MEQIVYHIENFEGPLDLLLYLISKDKVNICDINICELLDQYLEHIKAWQESNMDIASEFLEMASRLVYIKSVFLLPKHEEEAEELKDTLAGEILEYSICKKIADMLSKNTEGFGRFIRESTEPEQDKIYRLVHQKDIMASYYLDAVGRGLRRLPPSEKPFEPIVRKKIISVSSKIVFVLRNLWNGKKVKFKKLFVGSKSRSETVATFLAVLELIKAHRIGIDDNDELSILKKREGEPNE